MRMRPDAGVKSFFRVSALVAGVLAGSLLDARAAHAWGCSLHPKTSPRDSGTCAPPGDGCYICEYPISDGYMTCAESPDGTETYCVPGLQDQYNGSRQRTTRHPVAPAVARGETVPHSSRG